MAVCLVCGARKNGALVLCEACGDYPDSPQRRARQLLLCGPELTEAQAQRLADQVKAGAPLEEPSPEELAATIALLEQATPLRVAVYALVVGGAPILMVLVVVAMVALWSVRM